MLWTFLTSLLISSAASPPAASLKDIIEQEQNQATLRLDSPDEVHFTSALVRFYVGIMALGPSIQRLLPRYSLTQKRVAGLPFFLPTPQPFSKVW